MSTCPCGSNLVLDACCGPIVSGAIPAPTAEALMRSRFTAFSLNHPDHIRNTHAKEMRDADERTAARNSLPAVEWVKLEVLDTVLGGVDDDAGVVEFAAYYRENGVMRVHRERSNFRRDGGRWVYVDGSFEPGAGERPGKVGRNEPCPCGSGKKYKRCCGG